MKIIRDASNDLGCFFDNIDTLHSDPSIKGIMIFLCDDHAMDVSAINSKLKSLHKPVFGGVFPGVIYNEKSSDKGSIVVGIEKNIVVESFKSIEQISEDNTSDVYMLEERMAALGVNSSIYHTIAVFIDGLSPGVDRFKEQLFFNIGLESNYFGGGAGSLTFERRPCIITNEGLLVDAAVIAFIESKSGVGVAHGWSPVTSAIKVTEVDKNRIISLNWIPAFEYYKAEVEKRSGLKFHEHPFFDIAKSYPFGITKIGNEMIVRDPIEVKPDGSIVCVGELPKNAFVYILNGNKQSLVNGAHQALQIAHSNFNHAISEKGYVKTATILIDCISRALFLGNDFQEEIDVIGTPSLIGALTIGEIANTGKSYLELYNKTSVVAILED